MSCMKRSMWTNQIVCLLAAVSLLGQGRFVGAMPTVPSDRPTRAETKPLVATCHDATGSQSPPAHAGPTCGTADGSVEQFLQKESDRANAATVSPKPTGRIVQAPRSSLRAPHPVSDSQLLWIQTATTSLSARHVRLQV
jgi:hypothetical protein